MAYYFLDLKKGPNLENYPFDSVRRRGPQCVIAEFESVQAPILMICLQLKPESASPAITSQQLLECVLGYGSAVSA